MKIIKKIDEMVEIIDSIKKSNKTIGFVPTMGFLHEGHESLMKNAREHNDIVVVSVFVNPTQFGPDEDYDSYPRDLNRDSKVCEGVGVDYIFHPEAGEMYLNGYSTFVEPGKNMTDVLCGISRPGHFRGVCTVLTKLFNIISPDNAYFGEKDIQQLAIVKRMVRDFNIRVNINGCPIIREDDGLAKSSRNTYLSKEERKVAPILRKSLIAAAEMVEGGEKNTFNIKNKMVAMIENEEYTKIDYLEILDFETFRSIEELSDETLIAMAVYIGKTRLIDNIVINRTK